MKIGKALLGISLCVCGGAIFYFWAYDSPDGLNGANYVQVVSAPHSEAQLVVITVPAFQDGPDYYLGVRASPNQKWRQFSHSFEGASEVTTNDVGLTKIQIHQLLKMQRNQPAQSRAMGRYRWQDSDLKELLRHWKNEDSP